MGNFKCIVVEAGSKYGVSCRAAVSGDKIVDLSTSRKVWVRNPTGYEGPVLLCSHNGIVYAIGCISMDKAFKFNAQIIKIKALKCFRLQNKVYTDLIFTIFVKSKPIQTLKQYDYDYIYTIEYLEDGDEY